MAQALKKTARFCFRALLTVALFAVVLLVIVQLSLIAAVSYFNSGKASDEIQAYISASLKESGYNVTFDTASYYPVRGLTIRNIKVFDTQGLFLTVDHAALSVDISDLAVRHLDVSLKAGTVDMLRSPQGTPSTTPSEPLAPFSLPDIYFRTLEISDLSVKQLNIDAAVSGTSLSLSPSLEADIALKEQIEVKASLLPRATTKISDVSLPDKIQLAGTFEPATLIFKLDDLAISSPDYALSSKGTGSLAPDGILEMSIEAAYPDLKALTQENFEGATLLLQTSGALTNPAIKADGILKTASLKERGLEDINLAISSKDALNSQDTEVKINTAYQTKPIELTGLVTYDPEFIKIDSLKATAPFIDISGEASVPMQTLLPEGALHLSAADLSHYKELLQIELAGALEADVAFKAEGAALSADIKANLKGGKYDTISVARVDAQASFPDISSPWPQAVEAKIDGLSVSPTLSIKTADIGLQQKDAGIYGLALNGNGVATVPFTLKGSADLSNLSGVFPTTQAINLVLGLNQSSLSLTGDISPDAVNIKLGTKNFSAQDIPASLPAAASDIRLSGDVSMTGTPVSPVTIATITANGFDTGSYKNLLVSADAKHEAGKASASIKGQGNGIKTLKADVSVPVQFSLYPFSFDMDTNAALAGDFLSELELVALSPLFLPATQALKGNLAASGKIGGTIDAPDVNGTITLREGSFTDLDQGIELAKMSADAAFTNSLLTLRSFSATDNEDGHLNAKGQISLGAEQAGNIALTMKNFHLPKSEMANGHLDANLSLESAAEGFAAKGAIDIAEMNITIPETFMSNIPELNIIKKEKAPARSLSTSLDIKINAPNQIFVRGWGLDAEFGGTIDITGDASAPQFNGTLSSKRGRFEEFGKRFTLAHADLRFQGDLPPSPYLDIEATTPSDDITASVLLSGPVTKPTISFSSNPDLPQDEVLSRILFNKDSSKITPFQAIQLAQMIQRFSGKGGGSSFDPLGRIRAATGLNDISVDTDASGQTNVGVGKYLTDKVYLEVEKGKAANSGNATIQIEVTPQINIQSEIGQDSQTGGGIFWKRDY